MAESMAKAFLFAATLCLSTHLAGCGCAASPERSTERAAAAPDRHEAWGASFALPPGWSGGENDSGGYELTDGDLALLVGRHALDPDQSLDAFADEREQALRQTGACESLSRTEQHAGASRILVLEGRGTDAVEIRWLVARLGPDSGLSMMMVGDRPSAAKLDAAWTKLLGSLVLPGR
jgi:hypothetical protein